MLFGQTPLSAFAATSLWVVVGVSADNIFVFHETWRQASCASAVRPPQELLSVIWHGVGGAAPPYA